MSFGSNSRFFSEIDLKVGIYVTISRLLKKGTEKSDEYRCIDSINTDDTEVSTALAFTASVRLGIEVLLETDVHCVVSKIS